MHSGTQFYAELTQSRTVCLNQELIKPRERILWKWMEGERDGGSKIDGYRKREREIVCQKSHTLCTRGHTVHKECASKLEACVFRF